MTRREMERWLFSFEEHPGDDPDALREDEETPEPEEEAA